MSGIMRYLGFAEKPKKDFQAKNYDTTVADRLAHYSKIAYENQKEI